ncbi:MFS transporter [Microlunatus capsulatus]|uniref:MFS family permease n=1 Tax=Microlunatus capsulatus TaxID=99117 RepID=A0ABS4ZB47_9ACTN|nr:MFS transporter [Microlunatus capsulatus]MBP2418270.1 MFS family permease [Microlunatus capsulatus]
MAEPRPAVAPAAARSAWRAVVGFGVVSLAADMVYEGARSVTGPLLASLGATAVVVGLVTGLGEAVALVLRLFSGRLADRTGRYWGLTLAGYALTAVCVPLLAVTPFLGGAGLAVAVALVLAERTGKAVRSPAKSALLATAAAQVGMGRGLGVHKALDQVGAFAGPLVVAGVAALTGALWPAVAVLVVPGGIAMALLLVVRRRVGDPRPAASPSAPGSPPAAALTTRLPGPFWWFAGSSAAATAGLVTFGVISFHLTREQVLPVAAVPVVYAGAMAVGAVAALATGWAYDRVAGRVLLVLPVLVVLVPLLAFSDAAGPAVAGVLVWGAAVGVQDSTVKALVADLVPAGRRAGAYGSFAAVQGGAAVLGGAGAGWLYERSLPALVVLVALTQVVSLVLLLVSLRRSAAG